MEATESSRILPSKQEPKVLSYKVGEARQMGRQAAQGGVQGSGAISFFFSGAISERLHWLQLRSQGVHSGALVGQQQGL